MKVSYKIKKLFRLALFSGALLASSGAAVEQAHAQDTLPRDNGIYDYFITPEWRASESHPLRIAAYLAHPIGWVLREGISRPLSYFASSTETRRSVLGYRYPFDFRTPECFSSDDTVPDCRSLVPFNYPGSMEEPAVQEQQKTEVFFPNVNFEFDKYSLNERGKAMVSRIAELLKEEGEVKVVLQGHTDYVGSNQYNEELGMKRANSVRDELVSLGVSVKRLSTVSFGETVPLIDQKTDEARAANRRVETHVDQ